jgi:hypothetical protein
MKITSSARGTSTRLLVVEIFKDGVNGVFLMVSISELNLFLQLILLLGLTLGFVLVKSKKVFIHGWLMFTLTIINVASILFVMLPVAATIFLRFLTSSITLFVILHGALGAVVLFLSIRELVVWRFRKPGATCYKMKSEMLRLYIFWFAQVLLGIAIYYELYV